jgi:hypothetical protein
VVFRDDPAPRLVDDGGVMRTCEVELRDGKVDCPYSKGERVDVQTCYRCPRLRAFHDEESGTKVVCTRPAGLRRHLGLRS